MNFSYDEADHALEHIRNILRDEAKGNEKERAEVLQMLHVFALLKIADQLEILNNRRFKG